MRHSLAWILLITAVPAWAGEGRSLPRGEDNPLILEEVWNSPVGEVQVVAGKERTLLLRLESGELAELNAVEGPATCQESFSHASCSLVFKTETGNAPIRVSGGSLAKGSIFSNASSVIRGRHESL